MHEEGPTKRFYEFGPFVVDEARRRVLRGGEMVPLTKKEFDTLHVLVRTQKDQYSPNKGSYLWKL